MAKQMGFLPVLLPQTLSANLSIPLKFAGGEYLIRSFEVFDSLPLAGLVETETEWMFTLDP